MKPLVPYNVILVLAVAAMGLVALYNLALREEFSVIVGYDYPRPVSQPVQEAPDTPVVISGGAGQVAEDYDDGEDDGWHTEDTVVVLAEFPLDLNRATVEELMYIPKIGSVTAQRIVQYRQQLGGYRFLEQLKDIKGIGDKTFEEIAPYLYLQGEWDAGEEPEEAGEPPLPEE